MLRTISEFDLRLIHQAFTDVKNRLTVLFTSRDQNVVQIPRPEHGRRQPVTSQDRRDETTDLKQLERPAPETSDRYREMSRLLNSRRSEAQEGPFRGFGSPPGRF